MKLTENTKVTISLGLLVAVLIFLVSMTIAATGWKVELENRVSALESHLSETRAEAKKSCADLEELKLKQYEQDALFAEIRTDLKWIRTTLEENK